jgi:hypothetical protein
VGSERIVVTIMDDNAKRRILEQARDAVERTAHINPAEWSPRATPDVLKEWQRNKPQPEPKRRERGLDTAPIDWSHVIDQRVGAMKTFVLDVLAQALSACVDGERKAIKEALDARDTKINQAIETRIATEREYNKDVFNRAFDARIKLELGAVAAEILKRDKRIDQLESALAKHEIELARAQVERAQDNVRRERDHLIESGLVSIASKLN